MSVYLVNSESEDGETQSGSMTGVITEATHALHHFWPRITEEIRHIGCSMDLRTQALPLARIKKIMKLDEDVKMISAEAPVLFAKAAELFIQELTLRSWVHTEDNKRRTLQRNDIAMAITKYDQFDFLIDIVPREEPRAGSRSHVCLDQVHYYLQLNQQGGGQQQQAGSSEERMDQRQHVPILQDTVQTVALQETKPVSGNIQVVQQIMTPSGDVQHVPVQIPDRQMELIRLQVESQAPIVLTQPQLIQVRQQNPVYIDSSASPTN